jgi:hypothetical protein
MNMGKLPAEKVADVREFATSDSGRYQSRAY